jgi:molybdenum cofactor guanylyltransferase
MDVAGVVLVGGRSSRMGSSKAALEWHGSTLLRRTVEVVGRGVDGPVVVVRAPGQPLPDLPDAVDVRDDPEEGHGPLQGMAVGLAAAAQAASAAFVCSTDLPFLHPAFVRRVVRELEGDVEVVLPVARGYRQPLAAAYRTALAPRIANLLADGQRKPAFLLERCRVRQLDDAALLADPDLAAVDPDLDSVVNVNAPDDYTAARARTPSAVRVERFGTLARDGHRGPRTVHAATLREAAEAAGVVLDRHVVAAVNGERVTRDDRAPLVAGDAVAFISADAGG